MALAVVLAVLSRVGMAHAYIVNRSVATSTYWYVSVGLLKVKKSRATTSSGACVMMGIIGALPSGCDLRTSHIWMSIQPDLSPFGASKSLCGGWNRTLRHPDDLDVCGTHPMKPTVAVGEQESERLVLFSSARGAESLLRSRCCALFL